MPPLPPEPPAQPLGQDPRQLPPGRGEEGGFKGFYKGPDWLGRMLGKPPDREVNQKGEQFSFQGESPGWDAAYDERAGYGMQQAWPQQGFGQPTGGGFWQMLMGGGPKEGYAPGSGTMGPAPGGSMGTGGMSGMPGGGQMGGAGGGVGGTQPGMNFGNAVQGPPPGWPYESAPGSPMPGTPGSGSTPPFNPDPSGGMQGEGGGGMAQQLGSMFGSQRNNPHGEMTPGFAFRPLLGLNDTELGIPNYLQQR